VTPAQERHRFGLAGARARRHPLDPAEVVRRVAKANHPPRGRTALSGRIEGEPEPQYVPDELYRERLGMAFGYLGSYGLGRVGRTSAEASADLGPELHTLYLARTVNRPMPGTSGEGSESGGRTGDAWVSLLEWSCTAARERGYACACCGFATYASERSS
jgi:hypothetical protein